MDDCPVCKGPLQNPTEPISCCRKVFCQSCLKQAILARPQCPHCRSPINNRAALAFRSAICTIGLPGSSTLLQTTRTVSPNIQILLNQLRTASAQTSQTASAPNVIRPNPPPSNSVIPPIVIPQPTIRPLLSPVPRPRLYNNNGVAPAAPVTSNPISIQASTSSQLDIQSDDSDYMYWDDLYLTSTEMGFNSGYHLRTFKCPYCPVSGLDDLELRDHCNDNHHNDRRQVVCPVCVSLPHGNPTYCSRDFIGHLNLRHSYYIDDITNIHQNDYVNLQDTILRSLLQK